jgi:hypothetical protein
MEMSDVMIENQIDYHDIVMQHVNEKYQKNHSVTANIMGK